jgi:hypothetical protein
VKVLAYEGLAGREHAIDRVSKLEAVTVARGAAPTEAEFAARRARFLTDQFGLCDHSPVPANIDFRPCAPPKKTDATTSPGDASAAAAAYRAQPGERRRKSALRFVELA